MRRLTNDIETAPQTERTPRVAMHTLGCKLNYAETSTIGAQFREAGFHLVEFDQYADVYVINTCTVTANAEKDCRQLVRRAARKNPDAFIAVAGCYAQLRSEELARIPGVDIVLGTNEKFDIFKLTDSFEKKNLACVYVDDLQKRNSVINSAHSADGDDRTRAFLKIQDGCDYTCSFCTIPFARGGSRSIPLPEIKMSFQHLLSSGYKEIILTGVNVGDYGKNISSSLYQLLSALISVEGDFRIRVSSIEPNLISDELIDLFAGSGKLCNHFHIPLQSGSDKVLKLMQRRYNAAHYAERVARIKSVIPDAGIGVDVIVGFPGEDSKDFEETRLFLEHLPVSYLHVFTYSERPDTKAILMGNQVDKQVRKIRNRILRELSEKKRNDFTASFIGKNVKVLFEHQDSDGKMRGFSDNYLRCEAAFNADYVNQFSVRTIKRAEKEICYI